MTLKKLMSMLVMLAITTFIFTACEEEDPIGTGNTNPTITPASVGNVYVGQTGEKQITVQWDKSTSQDSTWFHGYQVKVTGGSTNVDTIITTHGGATTQYAFGAAELATAYTFTITTLGKATVTSGDSIVASSAKTTTWATATHFTKNDVGAEIKVYVQASSLGSGLTIYDAANEAPSTHTVQDGGKAKWNLGLGSSTKLIFGTASNVIAEMSYGGTGTPVDAEITTPLDFDFSAGLTPEEMLGHTLLGQDLSNYTFNKSYIDLKTNSIAVNNQHGLVFFAKVNNHYAKIILVKKNNSYLQGTGNDQYIQVLVSYQTREGIPYAKIFGKQ